jgi:hypothetical protein
VAVKHYKEGEQNNFDAMAKNLLYLALFVVNCAKAHWAQAAAAAKDLAKCRERGARQSFVILGMQPACGGQPFPA